MEARAIEVGELLIARRKLVVGTAARAIAVIALAFFSGAARSLVVSSSDTVVLGEAFLPPEWRLDFSWLGQASIALGLCYLGLELGFSVTRCLYAYGRIRYVERPRSMWALQWASAILLAASFAAHIAVVAGNGYIAGVSPLASGTSTSTAGDVAAVSLVCGLPPALIVCLLMRLRPKGRFFRRVRRINAWMRERHVARWFVMCALLAVQSCALTVFFPTAVIAVVLVVKVAATIIMIPIALFLFVLIMPAALNNR